MVDRLTRQHFLELSGLTLAALGLSGCFPTVPVHEKIAATQTKLEAYNGPMADYAGLPLLSPRSVREIMDDFQGTASPLGSHIARVTERLTSDPNKPEGFPDFVMPDSFPLPVVYNPQDSTSYAATQVNWAGPIGYLNRQEVGTPILGVQSVQLAVCLGVGQEAKKLSLQQIGLILAKETMSHLVSTRLIHEYAKEYGPEFLDCRQLEVIEGALKERIAASLLYTERGTWGSEAWKWVDLLPILFMAQIRNNLVKNGEMPDLHRGFPTLARAALLLIENAELNDSVEAIANKWVDSGAVLPPEGLLNLLQSEPMKTGIDELFRLIYTK